MLDAVAAELSLLRYALERDGKWDSSYVISTLHSDKLVTGNHESGYGLSRHGEDWCVYIYDRGQCHHVAVHKSIQTAVLDFFWRASGSASQYSWREEWQLSNGQSLNPFDLPAENEEL